MSLLVIYSPESIDDFSSILVYYMDFISYTMAENIEAGILKHIELLSTNPEIGHKDSILNRTDYKVFVSINYKIIYKVDEDKLVILRLFDSRQNPDKLQP